MDYRLKRLSKELESPTPAKKSKRPGKRPLDQKPNEPMLEDFGLSVRKLEYFQDPTSLPMPISGVIRRLADAGEKIGIPIALCAVGAFAVYTFVAFLRANTSLIGSLTLAFGLTLILTMAVGFLFICGLFFLMICLIPILEIWKRLDPDFKRFRIYRQAKENYYLELATWERTQEAWWQTLDGRRFEMEMALFLTEQGFQVQWTGKPNDGGVDLVLEKGGRKILVQCKAHNSHIGPGPVRDLYGTLIDRGSDEAWLVSTFGFSDNARNFAQGKPMRLFTISDVINERI